MTTAPRPTETDLKFILGLRYAVIERGVDYVYPKEWKDVTATGACVNRLNGEPACIVGLGAHKASLDIADTGTVYRNQHLLGISYILTRIASVGQGAQDMGNSWGEAWEAMQEEARFYGWQEYFTDI